MCSFFTNECQETYLIVLYLLLTCVHEIAQTVYSLVCWLSQWLIIDTPVYYWPVNMKCFLSTVTIKIVFPLLTKTFLLLSKLWSYICETCIRNIFKSCVHNKFSSQYIVRECKVISLNVFANEDLDHNSQTVKRHLYQIVLLLFTLQLHGNTLST